MCLKYTYRPKILVVYVWDIFCSFQIPRTPMKTCFLKTIFYWRLSTYEILSTHAYRHNSLNNVCKKRESYNYATHMTKAYKIPSLSTSDS